MCGFRECGSERLAVYSERKLDELDARRRLSRGVTKMETLVLDRVTTILVDDANTQAKSLQSAGR